MESIVIIDKKTVALSLYYETGQTAYRHDSNSGKQQPEDPKMRAIRAIQLRYDQFRVESSISPFFSREMLLCRNTLYTVDSATFLQTGQDL